MTSIEDLPLIYDVGFSNGDDTDYYLHKGWRVVAIDADPQVVALGLDRFANEIREGRLVLVHLGVGDRTGTATFHVNRHEQAISTFLPERFAGFQWVRQEWQSIEVPTGRLSDLVRSHGQPFAIKIDVEFHDAKVLLDLHQAGIVPPLMTVEAREPEVFATLTTMGYRAFRLLPGALVGERYAAGLIRHVSGERQGYRFRACSSGPIGEDFDAAWLSPEQAHRELLAHGLGWIDVHASLIEP